MGLVSFRPRFCFPSFAILSFTFSIVHALGEVLLPFFFEFFFVVEQRESVCVCVIKETFVFSIFLVAETLRVSIGNCLIENDDN